MIGALLLAAAATAAQPQTLYTIDPKHRLVEGVATDGRTVWVSSVLDRTILECRATCRTLATLPPGLHPLGLAWDQRRQRLWVAADCPKLPGVTPCERGALVALNRRGKLQVRIAPKAGAFHPGDVSVAGRELFVSDSGNGAVHRLSADARSLRPAMKAGVGKSAQGTVLEGPAGSLLAADYSHGVGRVDLATGERTILPRPDGKPLRGLDGVVRCGGRYVAVYNGSVPGGLIAFTTSATGLAFEELVRGMALPDPTQIAFDGKRLLVVANAGWEAASKGAEPRSAGAPIITIPVDQDCRPK